MACNFLGSSLTLSLINTCLKEDHFFLDKLTFGSIGKKIVVLELSQKVF